MKAASHTRNVAFSRMHSMFRLQHARSLETQGFYWITEIWKYGTDDILRQQYVSENEEKKFIRRE